MLEAAVAQGGGGAAAVARLEPRADQELPAAHLNDQKRPSPCRSVVHDVRRPLKSKVALSWTICGDAPSRLSPALDERQLPPCRRRSRRGLPRRLPSCSRSRSLARGVAGGAAAGDHLAAASARPRPCATDRSLVLARAAARRRALDRPRLRARLRVRDHPRRRARGVAPPGRCRLGDASAERARVRSWRCAAPTSEPWTLRELLTPSAPSSAQ